MHVLPVRRHHDRHHQGDGDADLPRPDVRRRARQRQHDEDLVGGVGDRREGVAGEDREGDALGQQRLAQLGAAELPAEQDPLGDVSDTHEPTGYGSTVHVVIMGCGRVGSTSARSLEDRNHTVSIIDSDPDAFRRLGPAFNGDKVTGYGFEQIVLEKAGIRRADAFAAVSSGDNSNIIAARVARETFGIQQVVARIYDPGRAEVYQRLGITTVATVKWTADQVLRRILPAGAEPDFRDPSGTHPRRPGAGARRVDRSQDLRLPGPVRQPDRLDRPARRGHAADPRVGDPGGRPAPPGDARGARPPRSSR